jgi:hypothetical protein
MCELAVLGLVVVVLLSAFTVAAAGVVVALVVPAGSTYWSFLGRRTLFYVIPSLSLAMLVGWGARSA